MNDVDKLLDKLRSNSMILSNAHRKRYLVLKGRLKYYRVPIIVVSACNSVLSVSLQPFVGQVYVSLINMFLSLMVGIISSLEMYWNITKQMEVEIDNQKDFYVLSCDIFKYLALDREKRIVDEKTFLNECWARYVKLVETSYILKKQIEDNLQTLPERTPYRIPRDASDEDIP